MICVVTKPVDLGNYIEMLNIWRRHPKDAICHLSWADFSTLKSTETLYLLAHGSATKVEDYTAEALATKLVKRGLVKTVQLEKIKLVACASGITWSGGAVVPYAQALADELVINGGPATIVVGFDGDTVVTDQSGRSYAKDIRQRDYPNWDEFKSKHLSTMTTWDAKAESMPYGTGKEMLENALLLEANVKDAFAWLYANNKLYTKGSVYGKTYGIPGQTFGKAGFVLRVQSVWKDDSLELAFKVRSLIHPSRVIEDTTADDGRAVIDDLAIGHAEISFPKLAPSWARLRSGTASVLSGGRYTYSVSPV
ncbi:MAG: hypothetical protein FJ027_24205 [Candidatus Rokubacteria bacterium]|nr:hypothetical protein [Candidatus Rokubacteria bacterium]